MDEELLLDCILLDSFIFRNLCYAFCKLIINGISLVFGHSPPQKKSPMIHRFIKIIIIIWDCIERCIPIKRLMMLCLMFSDGGENMHGRRNTTFWFIVAADAAAAASSMTFFQL